MQITLHIGATKTGSSALQAHLFAARHRLAKSRIFYPATGVASNAHHVLFAAVHPSAWALHKADLPHDETSRAAYFCDTMAQILDRAATSGADRLVLSSEYLWGALPDRFLQHIANALSGHAVRIVAVLRRQDLWLEATYLQCVKFGVRRPFDAWLADFKRLPEGGSDYEKVLGQWADTLSTDDVVVTPYEFRDRTAFTRGVANLICNAEVGHVVVPKDAAIVNPSPTLEGMQTLLADQTVSNRMWRPAGTQQSILFGPDEQRDVLEHYRAANERLAKRFAPDGPSTYFTYPQVAAAARE